MDRPILVYACLYVILTIIRLSISFKNIPESWTENMKGNTGKYLTLPGELAVAIKSGSRKFCHSSTVALFFHCRKSDQKLVSVIDGMIPATSLWSSSCIISRCPFRQLNLFHSYAPACSKSNGTPKRSSTKEWKLSTSAWMSSGVLGSLVISKKSQRN